MAKGLQKIDHDTKGKEWRDFKRRVKRLFADAVKLAAKKPHTEPKQYLRAVNRIDRRLMKIAEGAHHDPDAARLAKRIRSHCDHLFAFLDDPNVPPDNNRAEREIRPAVIARKNSFHNMSDRGARTQSILMSIYRTLKLRGHDPIDTIAENLALSIATGSLPDLPEIHEHQSRAP